MSSGGGKEATGKEATNPGPPDLLLGTPIEDVTDPDTLRSMCVELWGLLDNIDTLDDASGRSNYDFRQATRRQQQKRYQHMVSDGYKLFLPIRETANA